jgi:hypothetical protein
MQNAFFHSENIDCGVYPRGCWVHACGLLAVPIANYDPIAISKRLRGSETAPPPSPRDENVLSCENLLCILESKPIRDDTCRWLPSLHIIRDGEDESQAACGLPVTEKIWREGPSRLLFL